MQEEVRKARQEQQRDISMQKKGGTEMEREREILHRSWCWYYYKLGV